MARQAVLLIGTEKTGTTTLQQFLRRNRAALRDRGFLYPAFCGDSNHTGLAAYAMAPERIDENRTALGVTAPGQVPDLRRRIEAGAEAELSGATGTVLFVSEHCHSRLTTPEEIATLRGLLAPHFERIAVAVYLRRQDEVALSLYATKIKSGATDPVILPPVSAEDAYYNYERLLRMWEGVFGEGSVVPRLYGRTELAGGSIVTDFCARWGLGDAAAYAAVANYNTSLDATGLEFLRLANLQQPESPAPAAVRARGMMVAKLEKLHPGRGPRPSRQEAWRFYAKFRPSNELVRRRYFPERETLFGEDFGDYPEVAEASAIDVADAVRTAVQLHAAAIAEVARLEAELAMRDGRIAWLTNRRSEAVAALRRATQLAPQHPEMLRTLAEYLFQTGEFRAAADAARKAAERRPEAAEYWHFLGLALRRAGDLAGAAEAQRLALDRQPAYPGAEQELELLARSAAPAAPAASA